MPPECLCPIENGFHVECGSNGSGAIKGLPCWVISPTVPCIFPIIQKSDICLTIKKLATSN